MSGHQQPQQLVVLSPTALRARVPSWAVLSFSWTVRRNWSSNDYTWAYSANVPVDGSLCKHDRFGRVNIDFSVNNLNGLMFPGEASAVLPLGALGYNQVLQLHASLMFIAWGVVSGAFGCFS